MIPIFIYLKATLLSPYKTILSKVVTICVKSTSFLRPLQSASGSVLDSIVLPLCIHCLPFSMLLALCPGGLTFMDVLYLWLSSINERL